MSQVNIGELERPDQKPEPILGLPGIMARSIGRDIEQIYAGSNKVREWEEWELIFQVFPG